ncbi:acyl-CoA synthetase (NDP forming)/GNAT superfamily N-acetyltransferase [Streptosporangium album]|uniref:Acyl-CoA synthetase (NDP forming)/GNAT superfamily N-acetyltransferase n=1 Tax=Streptosporangium album TaxID=47479 RepID=A0A7W7S327_9ACTN|nr:bifunctional GNAT family N-acetyltransferase/acetate--CoA ligase family protein [Streptosporangium album]MBB4943023.1 acyl-CoA synthetase (NDP forming)/GNAT superfamily N-acetyltransferase [Streptosporangium album]
MRRAVPDECDALLREGGIAHIRPLRPDDRARLHELVDRSSERSAYLRFFTGGTASAHAYMDHIATLDYSGRALVAVVNGQLVAVAEYIPGDAGDAEIAILVDDGMHHRGLGTLLVEHLALNAADEGVRELVANVLAENRPMLRMLDDVGLTTRRAFSDGTVEIRMDPHPTPGVLERIEERAHQAASASLTRLFCPESVAVIGAGRAPGGVGHRILCNLLQGGFPGPVYPINPHARQLCGMPAYASVKNVPGPIDLAIIATPARTVLELARDCAGHGMRDLVVVTTGFAEAGETGAEDELLRICREAGIRLVGPNCLGIVNTEARLNASFLPHPPIPGRLALMSQSGAIAVALIDRAIDRGTGISSFASVGNKADVSGNDLLEYWEDDLATDVIALYLESFGNPRRFERIARRVSRRKPIIAIKSGRGGSGERAVRSHTAAAATPDVAVDALLKASGIIRVETVQDMLDTACLLAAQPLPQGSRVAIVGNSGGPQTLAADACEQRNLLVPELAPVTCERLRARLPVAAAVANPVDLTAGGSARDLAFAVETALADPGIDIVLVVYTPPFGSGLGRTRQAISHAATVTGKTVVACITGHDGLLSGRVPCYAFPEQAVRALRHAVDYASWRAVPQAPPAEPHPAEAVAARDIVEADLARHPGGRWLDYGTAARLLGCYGVQVAEAVEAVEVDGPDSAAEAAVVIEPPVVLKATGPDLVHKSDIGGVRVGLGTPDEAGRAYREMAGAIGPAMTGAIVQPMVEPGVEIIIGGVAHEAFGPLLMIGMGGVTAELLADRSFRVPPLSDQDPAAMIAELRCAPLLAGYRGRPCADIAALRKQVAGVGRLLDNLPEVAELDLNPVIVTPADAVVVDVRIRLAPAAPPLSLLRRRLR